MKNIVFGFCMVTLLCCQVGSSHSEQKDLDSVIQNNVTKIKSEISHILTKQSSFYSKQFIQGKLIARSQATIKTENTGVITSLQITDGGYIEQGSLILSNDDVALQYDLANARLELDDAIFKKRERLILDGGDPDDDLSVSPEKLKIIHTLSGYDKALQAIKQIEFQISRTKLYAPFSGRIADVRVYAYEMVNAGETICTLINTGSFEVEMAVLEDIALSMEKGQSLTVHPLSDPTKKVKATVHVINPIVDENGLVKIRARLNKHSYRFFENMNLQVILENKIDNVITIPKEALVIRSGKEVVFTYDKESERAKWNYVTVLDQNDESLAISEGLSAGELVIIEGNLNLDHDAEVVVKDSLTLQ